ncbi:hypothetical protein K438DRAFT_1749761 [Mycena galopus ATCC 62051]|nr:hypothetical protein K438DRAFT_1749761 [Mycena galopus ATCC 62051]
MGSCKYSSNVLPFARIRRGTRKRDTDELTQSLATEKADEDGNPFFDGPRKSHARVPRVKAVPESVSDQEDNGFELPDLVDPSDSEGSDDEMDVDNDELVSILMLKTVPQRGKTRTQTRGVTSSGKRKQTSDSASAPAAKKLNCWVSVEDVDDEDAPPIQKQTSDSALGTNKTNPPTVEEHDEDGTPTKPRIAHLNFQTRNPIYLFYEVVTQNSAGRDGTPGDKHYYAVHFVKKLNPYLEAARPNILWEVKKYLESPHILWEVIKI